MDYIEKISDIDEPVPKANKAQAELRVIHTEFDSLKNVQVLKEPPIKKRALINKRTLINKLNYKNFQNESVQINFIHHRDKRIISLNANPQPCFGKNLVCLWGEKLDIQKILNIAHFQKITFVDGQNLITIAGSLRSITNKGICLTLPDSAVKSSCRRARRFVCGNLDARLIQNGIVFKGVLVDFSPISFHVELFSSTNEPFQWINSNDGINLIISSGNDSLYSGQCTIIKQSRGTKQRNIILQPINDSIQRFAPRTYRSNRSRLSPSPDIFFNHPFTDKYVNLKVLDISGSGISVEDDEESAVLLPGMIIPDLTLNFARSFNFHCKAQVVYRRSFKTENGGSIIKCGIAFLDMNVNDHTRLLSLIHQAENSNLYICNEVDMNELWAFLFNSSFIYPKKYAFISDNKEKVKQTFKKLYTIESSIARHFTWQKKGLILGHLSMLRFYENTWMIHHLAALKSDQHLKIAEEMLRQIGSFTYDSHRLYSSHMEYLMCYFRPDNKFPNHFFGGVARSIDNPKECSLDTFAYMHYHCRNNDRARLTGSWKLMKSTYDDLVELENFYEQNSNGLMIRAFDLSPEPEMIQRHELANEYKRVNLKRKRSLFSLKHDESLKAVLQVNVSDILLNLSDLTNCVTVFLIDEESLTPDAILAAVSEISNEYEIKKIPLLLYPHSIADLLAIPCEKLYQLWILDMQFSDDYFKHLETLL